MDWSSVYFSVFIADIYTSLLLKKPIAWLKKNTKRGDMWRKLGKEQWGQDSKKEKQYVREVKRTRVGRSEKNKECDIYDWGQALN